MLLLSSIVVMAVAASPRDVVGAERPRRTITTSAPAEAGTIETTCMVFPTFAVVVTDETDTRGRDGTEVRDRVGDIKDEALCAAAFAGPKRTLMMDATTRAFGYFLAVKGPLVMLRGDDGFGAHDVLTIFRAKDGAMVLDTIRYDDEPLVLRQRRDVVTLQYLQALKVGCDPRAKGKAHAACVQQLRADNHIADDVKANFDVDKACKRVPATSNVQLGVAAVIADGRAPVVRIVGGKVFCSEEP